MHEDGFASMYFLSIFLAITVLMSLSLERQNNQLRSQMNTSQANLYAAEEAAALSSLHCMLLNNRIEENFENGLVSGRLTENGSIIRIDISSPYPETLFVTINEDKKKPVSYEVRRDAAEVH